MSTDQPPGRRRFLKSAAAAGAVVLSGSAQPHETHTREPSADAAAPAGERIELAQASSSKPLASQLQAYAYFTSAESDFVETAVARLIPDDEIGPGAKEAGVAFFIDQQLAGSYGTLGRGYRLGPSPEGTPQQGFQGPLTPQEIYRAAIRDVDKFCRKTYGKRFAELPTAQQEEILTALEAGKITLEQVSAQRFFALLWNNTQEGFFADPMYGGNRDKVGWKLIGFPGVAAVYTNHIDKHGVPYQSTHNTGGVVMGADPNSSAVNKYLQSWDVPNLFVVGASAFPQNGGYNPTGTIGALTYHATEAIKTRYLKRPGPLAS